MLGSIIGYSSSTVQLLQSVTPFFGEPYSYKYDRNMDRVGDVAAKAEARTMIRGSNVVPDVPVMFDDENTSTEIKTGEVSIEVPSPPPETVSTK